MGRKWRLLAFFLPAAISAVWTIYAGKDVNWDLLNYHYYVPFELLAARLDQDFFAASAQSYLNPVGYLPFYLMVSSGWHSVAASVALAVAHSLSIGLLFLLAWRLFGHLPRRSQALFSCLATGLGVATSVFWATVGTSFLDPLLIPPMLAGLLLLLGGNGHAMRRAVLGGALFGVAAALKYSNAIFALAALPLVATMPGLSGISRLRCCLGYAAGGAVAVGALAGPWIWLMTHEFGNPVFPLMNAWFQSPYAPPVNMISERFALGDFGAALRFPFEMVALGPLYSENFAPDLRFAALLIGAAFLPLVPARRSLAGTNALGSIDARVFAFFCAALVLWLGSSANGRYGMVVLLVAGVCLARCIERLLPLGAARVVLAVLLVIQLGMAAFASPSRWYVVEPWSLRWLPYEVPERAAAEPALYVTVEELPMAVLAPFLHPASSFVNLRGQYSVPSDSPKLAALLERHRGRVRALGRGLQLVDGYPSAKAVSYYDATLARIGYRVDRAQCLSLAWTPESDDLLSRVANRLAGNPSSHPRLLSAGTCQLRPAQRDPGDVAMEKRVSSLFDRMESACPQLFHGQTALTERLGMGWSRLYPGLDARLETDGDRVILYHYRRRIESDLGRLGDWTVGRYPAACR